MDSFELNKIAGAILFTCLVVLGLSIVSEALFTAPTPAQPGYEVAIAEEASGEAATESEGPDLGTLLAAADPAAGEGAVRPCVACHTFEQGGEAKVGPNLYNIVGGPKAHMEGFNYSEAMQEAAAAGEGWGYEELDAFLANPRGYIPGTTMAFAGVRDPETRADIVMYLASLTENAPPPPEPQEAGAEEAAPAEGEPAPDGESGTDGASGATEPAGLDHPEGQQTQEPAAQDDAAAAQQDDPQVAQTAPAEQQTQEPAQDSTAAPAPAQEQTAAEPAGDTADAQGEASELHQLIAAADPSAGQSAARPCAACHTFEEGAANRVGPNLYDVVGNEMARRDDYSYSTAMQEAAAAGGVWSYEELDSFLTSPREHLPGTTMAFAGVRDAERRAALIAYMRELSDSPPPLPGAQ